MGNKRKKIGFLLLFFGTLILASCGREASQSINPSNPQPVSSTQERMQLSKTIVIQEWDREEHHILGASVLDDQIVMADFDGTTALFDAYQTPLTVDQFAPGDLVDLLFEADGQLVSVTKTANPDCWEVKGITDLAVNRTDHTMLILNKTCHYTNGLVVVSKEEPIELLEVNDCDKVTVRGYKGKAYAIVIEEGHGYVKLKNYDTYIGGTVSIGNQVIVPVMEDMLLTVREGSYKLVIEKEGHAANKTVLVKRDQTTKVNLLDVQIPPAEECRLVLDISPDDATVRIDQNLIDVQKKQTLSYGTHHIQVTCNGYQDYEADFTIHTTYLKYTVALEEENTAETFPAESNTRSSSENQNTSNTEASQEQESSKETPSTEQIPQTTTAQTKNNNKSVYILEPKNAKVYVDGLYQGVSPLSFAKKAGDHVITFSKEGYVTKSYKITVVDDGEDSNMSFPAMLAK